MCDDQVFWLREVHHSLEIIAYYTTANLTIPSWSGCLEEDGREFLKRNYTWIDAGEVDLVWRMSDVSVEVTTLTSTSVHHTRDSSTSPVSSVTIKDSASSQTSRIY